MCFCDERKITGDQNSFIQWTSAVRCSIKILRFMVQCYNSLTFQTEQPGRQDSSQHLRVIAWGHGSIRPSLLHQPEHLALKAQLHIPLAPGQRLFHDHKVPKNTWFKAYSSIHFCASASTFPSLFACSYSSIHAWFSVPSSLCCKQIE